MNESINNYTLKLKTNKGNIDAMVILLLLFFEQKCSLLSNKVIVDMDAYDVYR